MRRGGQKIKFIITAAIAIDRLFYEATGNIVIFLQSNIEKYNSHAIL